LEYVGRIDTQVKIRGYRIELGEIDAALAQAPGVRETVVMARTDSDGKRLVAYVVPQGGPEASGRGDRIAAYRQHLAGQLPGYMVPELYVELAALPVTGSGKVDRKALPAPEDRDLNRAAYVAPRTEMESQLAELWQVVLKLERVGVEDNFFALGGHSLLATRLVSLMRKELGVEVPLRTLFERPTVAGLAEALHVLSGAEAVLPPIPRAERDRDAATLVAAVTGKRKTKKMLI
jgi:acyl carrier protein